uniref:AAA family ATPase n=1 Tax=Paractinoplanes polyasparticus TaxID=2856853 RepID=UPI001C84BA37|nr:AAA family ATPase [Actinoplanes polyasparticus]
MTASTPAPAVDLIEHAAGIIVKSKSQPYTAPYHWAGALWEAGMLVAPGTAAPVVNPGTLTVTRGLPGCGKTTYARAWVAESPATRSRSNRDDLGQSLHGRRFYGDEALFAVTEDAITTAQHAQILALLNAGRDVICDDINLDEGRLAPMLHLAMRVGAEIQTVDMRDVPLEVVLERNAQRADATDLVPEAVIRDMWERHVAAQEVSPL